MTSQSDVPDSWLGFPVFFGLPVALAADFSADKM
jgi:hypothetical protein